MNNDTAREVQESAIKNAIKRMVEEKALTVDDAEQLETSLLKNESQTSSIESTTVFNEPIKKGGK